MTYSSCKRTGFSVEFTSKNKQFMICTTFNPVLDTSRFDIKSFRFMLIQSRCTWLKEREIFTLFFSCYSANYTWSDRNRCAVSLLEFVSKQVCIKTIGFHHSSTPSLKEYFEHTSSFISWNLSSRARASSFVLRYWDSAEAWAPLTSAVSCLCLDSSRRSARRSTSAEWSRWVKPRMWLWSAPIVRCVKKICI